MIAIWMVTGTAYAVATFLLISIGEAAALHAPGGDAAGARLHMRMWADTVLFGMSWALGWILTMKFAGRRPRPEASIAAQTTIAPPRQSGR